MFGTQWTTGKRKAERLTEDAWDNLQSLVESAGRRTSDLAGEASDKVSAVTDEAWRRANRAVDALAGRKSRTPWGWIAVAALAGVAVGWAAAAGGPKAIAAAQEKLASDDEEEEVAPASTL